VSALCRNTPMSARAVVFGALTASRTFRRAWLICWAVVFVIGFLVTLTEPKAGMLAAIFALFGLGWWIAAALTSAMIRVAAGDVSGDCLDWAGHGRSARVAGAVCGVLGEETACSK
jgi:hypothetical protein